MVFVNVFLNRNSPGMNESKELTRCATTKISIRFKTRWAIAGKTSNRVCTSGRSNTRIAGCAFIRIYTTITKSNMNQCEWIWECSLRRVLMDGLKFPFFITSTPYIFIIMNCGCGAKAAPPNIRSRLHGYLVVHLGRDWGTRRCEGRRKICMDKWVRIDVVGCQCRASLNRELVSGG